MSLGSSAICSAFFLSSHSPSLMALSRTLEVGYRARGSEEVGSPLAGAQWKDHGAEG